MRRTTTLTALLLGATLLAPSGSATAVGETCRGEAATIVGTSPRLVGTDGRDVIVTGASFEIMAGAGDDVICVTESTGGNTANLDAGAGNDLVDSTALPALYYLTALLGDGSDTFVGGAGSDSVRAGAAPGFYSEVPSEAERDVIDTGDGSDSVTSGGPGLVNDDTVRTGNGEDAVTWSGTMGAQAVLDAGPDDRDTLIARASGQTFGVDIAKSGLTRNGAHEASFSSFEDFLVVPEPDLGSLEILGSEGDDDVQVTAPASLRTLLGAGDDRLTLSAAPLADSVVDLGSGRDYLAMRGAEQSLDLDLEDHVLQVDDRATATVHGVENTFVVARKVRLEGDRDANSLSWRGCFGQVEGGAGKDFISLSYDPIWETSFDCSRTKVVMSGEKGNDTITGKLAPARILGGGGNDKLTGSSKADIILGGGGRDKLAGKSGNDVLVGGGGRDKAAGSKGRDRCTAEVETSCER